jgi:hypothetical protein
MMEAISNYFLPIIGILVLIGILEIIMSAVWLRFYFIIGIPLFRRTIKVTSEKILILSAQELEDDLPELAWRPPLLVRNIDTMKFAFREKLLFLGFSYVPVMHGCMNYDSNKEELVISGFDNWYALLFSIFFIFLTVAFMFESKELMFLILPIGLLLIEGNGYLTQRRRFSQVVETLQFILTRDK